MEYPSDKPQPTLEQERAAALKLFREAGEKVISLYELNRPEPKPAEQPADDAERLPRWNVIFGVTVTVQAYDMEHAGNVAIDEMSRRLPGMAVELMDVDPAE